LREDIAFSPNLIMTIVKQAEAENPVPELCRENGISSAIFYKWRRHWRALGGEGKRAIGLYDMVPRRYC